MPGISDFKRWAWRTITGRAGIVALCLLFVLVMIHVVLGLVWGRDLRAAQARLVEAGLPTAPGQVSPTCLEVDNAAPLYVKAFVLMTLDSGKVFSSSSSGKLNPALNHVIDLIARPLCSDPSAWTQAERDDTLAVLESADFTRIRLLIDEAVTRPRCCFDLDYGTGPDTRLPHIIVARESARLLACRARLLGLAGRLRDSADAHRVVLGLGRQQCETPVFICQLVGLAMDALAIESLHQSFNAGLVPDESLPALATACEAMDARTNMVRAFDGERLLFGEWVFDALANGRMGSDLYGTSLDDASRLGFIGGWLYRSFLGAPLVAKDHAIYLDRIVEMRRQIEQAEKPGKWVPLPSYARLTSMLLPSADMLAAALERHRVTVDLARLAVALRRAHARDGSYPDALSALSPSLLATLPAGTLNHQPYTYRRLANGFALSAEPVVEATAKPDKKQRLIDAWTWSAGSEPGKPGL